MALPTIRKVERPMILTRMQAVTVGSNWSYRVHFEILAGNDAGVFSVGQQQTAGIKGYILCYLKFLVYFYIDHILHGT